jgi:hypothetical protein
LRIARNRAGAERRSDLLGLISVQDVQAGAGLLQRVDIRERLRRRRMGAFMRAGTPLSPAAERMLPALTMVARSLQ